MRKVDQCPVTHVTLHSLLKDLAKQGVIENHEFYRPSFGFGSRYTYQGEYLEFKMGYVGKVDWLQTGLEQALVFHEPHDLVYVAKTKTLLTFVRSA